MARDIVRVHSRRGTVALLFEPRDAWVGVYVRPSWVELGQRWHAVYICLVPFVPLYLAWTTTL